MDKAKLKMELEAFGRMLRLKWHFRNENKDIHRDMFKGALSGLRHFLATETL